ncbi:MAG: ATP-binding cassette domain-containing protein [Rhodobacteraceae bacterium]|nr:ATP-binding cassette domain-containing protein [Paracoccaceae bacterium]
MITVESLQRSGLGPISFTVGDGECLAITGPSGAGKSLLMRAIVDLDPNTGEVTTGLMNRAETPAPEWRKHVALLPSETGWWMDNVGDHFLRPTKIAEHLPEIGLSPDAMSWDVSRLSSGERHRLGLLRCLEKLPNVLLLDEPTAALDTETTTQVEALLHSLMEKGITILLVTHDVDQPARLGCKTMHIENGQVVA